jgi:hypothetical protein
MGSLSGLDFNEWALALSGGYDSRGILCYMLRESGRPPGKIRTISWGLERSILERGNDARVARDLAGTLGVSHKYYTTEVTNEPFTKVMDRFLSCGEGRTDQLSGYADGMKIWKDLRENGIRGIIRGDEGFGWLPVSSELTARSAVGYVLCSDYPLLEALTQFGLPPQGFLDYYRQNNETPSTWRDRLYHVYRLPTMLAALSDLKLSYIELINPLLSRRILNRVRELPDHLRDDKALFKDIVNSISPDIPYATKGATAAPEDILRKAATVDLMQEILHACPRELINSEFIDHVLKGITASDPSNHHSSVSLVKTLKKFTPLFIKNFLRDGGILKQSIDPFTVAFRVCIIIRMYQMFCEDGKKITE